MLGDPVYPALSNYRTEQICRVLIWILAFYPRPYYIAGIPIFHEVNQFQLTQTNLIFFNAKNNQNG